MSKRVPKQALLPFGVAERVVNRQIRQRAAGVKVTRGPGRPPRRDGTAGVRHRPRGVIGEKTAVHATIKVRSHVPSLRSRKRFAVIRDAFVKFCAVEGSGFRLIHFAVLGDHIHLLLEVDSAAALSKGMQRLGHSISRRLNALNVKQRGGKIKIGAGLYRNAIGWLGKIFSDRFHSHILKSPTEMSNVLKYIRTNAAKHYADNANTASRTQEDPFSSFVSSVSIVATSAKMATTRPHGFLLHRAWQAIQTTLAATT